MHSLLIKQVPKAGNKIIAVLLTKHVGNIECYWVNLVRSFPADLFFLSTNWEKKKKYVYVYLVWSGTPYVSA